MERNFDKPLTIEDYAYLTGRSESTFRREFKIKYGVYPQEMDHSAKNDQGQRPTFHHKLGSWKGCIGGRV